ncbi:MAG: 4'-phosphopantetheinyl transferase family protein, partial [Pyrinomonadaceae bacterium]
MPETAPAGLWCAPPEDLSLGSDEVHVWRAALDRPAALIESLWASLSADERARAARFHFRKDRDHYVVARGVLRMILARYLNAEPGALRFRYNSYGKPALAVGDGGQPVRFNLSHSGGLALYAFTASGRELGIDVEGVRPDFASDEVAGRFFSSREIEELRAQAPEDRADAFFN